MKQIFLPTISFECDDIPYPKGTPFFLGESYPSRVEKWEEIEGQSFDFFPAAREILKRENLNYKKLEKASDGSLPVFLMDEKWVLKLFTPLLFEDFEVELKTLEVLQDNPHVPVPGIHSANHFEKWPYIIQSYLPGKPLNIHASAFSEEDRHGFIESLGRAISRLHQVSKQSLHSKYQCFNWDLFEGRQLENCINRQKGLGLTEPWIFGLEQFLSGAPGPLKNSSAAVFLHTELMDNCLFYQEKDGCCVVSGICDWAEAFWGSWEYEIPSLVLFVTHQKKGLLRRFLKAYGVPEKSLNLELQYRFMRSLLMHRYCHLPWFFKLYPPQNSDGDFFALSEQWFAY